MLREKQVRMIPGSALEYAHRVLSRLDELIIVRQLKHMGHGVARLGTLANECEFFERTDAQLAPIVLAAERVANPMKSPDESHLRKAWRRLRR
jgi:hypothetical protein